MFISPKLNTLALEADISPCNFNNVCEKDLGENSGNCRNDCKPVGKFIFYIILVFIFGVILYTAMQMWYKARYESYLFKDRKQLFNLVMFITNARARGMDDEKIKEMPKKQKWTNEKIIYALKKSRGERTGLYEIVPVERLFAYFRELKVKSNIATGNMGQNMGNINKSSVSGLKR
jgi:hypothetical protein